MSRLEYLTNYLTKETIDVVPDYLIQEYCTLAKHAVINDMEHVISAKDLVDKVKYLEQIFDHQYRLMLFVNFDRGEHVSDALFEVAKEFDNKNPDEYNYLMDKISKKGYLIQQS